MGVAESCHELPALVGGKPVRDKFLPFSQLKLSENEIAAVEAVLRSGWLTTAGRTKEFEHRFREYVGTRHAVALNSCTAGIFLSLKVLGIGSGDEVITTPLTFAASVNAIEHVDAKPIFADIDPVSWCVDPLEIEKLITRSTRAILPVHLYGRPCDMDVLMDISRKHGLPLVQDCAHAVEGEWRGKKLAAYGDLACYSFYATKNITTGEGGMVATDREDWADRIRTLALHGLDKTAYDRYGEGGKVAYDLEEPGYKFNMPDVLAAIGVEGLALVERRYKRRVEIWERYKRELADLPGLTLPVDPEPDTRHAMHLFACTLDPEKAGLDRDRMIEALSAENIGTGIHYTPVHRFAYYHDKYRIAPEDLPSASSVGERLFSLPFTPFLTDEEVEDVIRAVRRIILHHSKVTC